MLLSSQVKSVQPIPLFSGVLARVTSVRETQISQLVWRCVLRKYDFLAVFWRICLPNKEGLYARENRTLIHSKDKSKKMIVSF